MNGAVDLLAFAGVMALGQFSPGPDMILLTRTALRGGSRAGVEMAFGIACGLAVHAAVTVAGLAQLLERFPVLWEALRWAAAGYLLWLACRIFMEVFAAWYSGGIRMEINARSTGRPWFRGFLCNLLNPKVAIFLAAVCAPFLKGARPEWWPFALWGIVVGQGCLLWSMWARLLQWKPLRRRYERAARWIDGAFGIVLAALAMRLIVG